MQEIQLRIGVKQWGTQGVLHVAGKNDGGFEWEVVTLLDGQEVDEILTSGEHLDLDIATQEGLTAFRREITKPDGPVRHDWECSCGAHLSVEARRSRRSPYSWDSPREVTCSCGRVYGVKLNFAERTAVPRLEAIYRTMTNVSPRT